jgi:hypothetical protein
MIINWPDRMKITIFGIILVPFIALVVFLILAFTGVFTKISMNQGVVISVAIAIALDIFYTARKWKKLKQYEIAGNMPDMTNQKNISLPRVIVAMTVLVLAVASYVNYTLYSVATAKLLLLVCFLISVIEIIYLKVKRKN